MPGGVIVKSANRASQICPLRIIRPALGLRVFRARKKAGRALAGLFADIQIAALLREGDLRDGGGRPTDTELRVAGVLARNRKEGDGGRLARVAAAGVNLKNLPRL